MRHRSYDDAEAFTREPANESKKRHRARNIAEGMCSKARSHGPPVHGKTKCAGCIAKDRSRRAKTEPEAS